MTQKPKETRPSEMIYQVYPASFRDADGDGHGDLKGITEKLDYVKGLGFDAIWISPFFRSPPGAEGDGGYAISNYREIDPRFGTMEDFEELLKQAHEKGLRIYTDSVLCHTSRDHEWFQKSCKREEGFEDYYVWHKGHTDAQGKHHPPNNWKSVFGGSAWEWNDERGEFYMHHFNVNQPAVNLNNPAVQDAAIEEMKFWVHEKGVDGLRLDAIPYANYDPLFRNDEPNCTHSMCQPQTVSLAAKIRRSLDNQPGRKISTLGEAIADPAGGRTAIDIAADLVQRDVGLDCCYTNSQVANTWYHYPTADELKWAIKRDYTLSPDGGLCTNASNHDFDRIYSRLTANAPEEVGRTMGRQYMALCLALPGSYCMYQGEELGLPQARIPQDIPYDRLRDRVFESEEENRKRSRDGARTGFPSDSTAVNCGFSECADPKELYLPIPDSHRIRSVDIQEGQHNPESMLEFTRRKIQQRKTNPALDHGIITLLDTKEADIVAFIRETDDQKVLCAFNMRGKQVSFKPSDYIKDPATLEQLGIEQDEAVRIGSYRYSMRGLRGPSREKIEPAVRLDSPSDESPRIFALDMIIAGHPLPPVHENADLAAYVEEAGLQPQHRRLTDEATHQRLMGMTTPPEFTLGGQTATTLYHLKQFMEGDVEIDYMGLAANDAHGIIAKNALEAAGVNILTKDWPAGFNQETAVSHQIPWQNGRISTITYAGPGIDALKETLEQDPTLLEKAIKDTTIVYIPGSATEKYGQTLIDRELELRWKHGKELVLALPTHAKFGPTDKLTFKNLIASANVVMGSDTEFSSLCNGIATRPITELQQREVIEMVQQQFKRNVLKDNGMPCPHEQVAFITRGSEPALLVTATEVKEIPVKKVAEERSLSGLGEVAFAGFMTGYLKGMPHEKSAKLAMALAGEKVQQEASAHLENPSAALKRVLLQSAFRPGPTWP